MAKCKEAQEVAQRIEDLEELVWELLSLRPGETAGRGAAESRLSERRVEYDRIHSPFNRASAPVDVSVESTNTTAKAEEDLEVHNTPVRCPKCGHKDEIARIYDLWKWKCPNCATNPREKWATWMKKTIAENQLDLAHEFEDDSNCKNCDGFGPHLGDSACPFKMGVLVGMQQKEDELQNESPQKKDEFKQSNEDVQVLKCPKCGQLGDDSSIAVNGACSDCCFEPKEDELKGKSIDTVIAAASGMVEYWKSKAEVLEKQLGDKRQGHVERSDLDRDKETARIVAHILEGLLDRYNKGSIISARGGVLLSRNTVLNFRSGEQQALDVIERARKETLG